MNYSSQSEHQVCMSSRYGLQPMHSAVDMSELPIFSRAQRVQPNAISAQVLDIITSQSLSSQAILPLPTMSNAFASESITLDSVRQESQVLDPSDSAQFGQNLSSRSHAMMGLHDKAIEATRCGVTIADAQRPGLPIIYCNPAFEALTGYSFEESVGHNCRFLQGEDTDPASIQHIRNALRSGKSCRVVVKNYRKDKTPFWNDLTISPVHDEAGELTHFIGVQTDVSARKQVEEALEKQVKRENLLRCISERIYQSESIDEILNTAVTEVRSLLQTDRTVIYKFHEDWSGSVAVESVGQPWQPIIGLDIQDTCFKDSHVPKYQDGRVRTMDDIETEGLTPCHLEMLKTYDVRANLVVPILQDGKLWGLLLAHHCRAPRHWKTDEVQLLQHIAVQMAIALKQAELKQQLQNELDERRRTEEALRRSETCLRDQTFTLQTTLEDLRQAQTHLVQSEKMSSLGRLVAGVAHEINNPVGFISGNLKYVKQYTQDLTELIKLYQASVTTPIPELVEALETKDMAFVLEDFPKVLQSMEVGAGRICDIIKSLRNFSRLDEAEMKAVDIHEGIENTLMILSNRIKEQPHLRAIELHKEYGNIPQVQCSPGQLNQVIMNILSNGIDALENCRDYSDCPVDAAIRIETCAVESDPDWIAIRISDTGPGIDQETLSHIFDPFFTTKPVGKGTGMGLAISYQIIVEKHRGTLTCKSEPSRGTEFLIQIPIRQPEADL
ncbi:MAG: ATP-binding protein [Elainellaceae cyanobacterium]